ncbi:hypothetical protein GCM10009796_23610 [Microbacterium koreense]|uniref:hypothetical protein n=1 Tax=Microbacterium koreense TaxID=323761 RepID=UPI00337DE825
MKDVVIHGTRLLTTDEVADSLLDYARVLNEFHRADTVRFPAVVDGSPRDTALALGAHAPLVVIDAPEALPVRLRGAGEAAMDIRRRTAILDDTGSVIAQ